MDLYYIIFLPLSVFGIITNGYTFGFHLLHIVVGNEILHRVLLSVTKNAPSLLWVGLLGVVIIYIYSLFAFAFYRSSFVYQDGMMCDTMWECFLTLLSFGKDLLSMSAFLFFLFSHSPPPSPSLSLSPFSSFPKGLRSGGGIGDVLDYSSFSWFPYMTFRAIFDLSFFIIVIIIGLNIIFGIIVDTFSQLRDEKNFIEEDNKRVCFICSLQR